MEPILPGPGTRAPPALTDHLLEEILVRLSAPTDLIRASAVCATFRRLITDPAFLRHYRSLHPPLLLGFVHLGFLPVEEPHPNAAAGRAFARGADFSFDHLPDRGPLGWACCDTRDGRALLMYEPDIGLVLPELAVSDPLSGGYTLLPPIPDNLVASVLVQLRYEHIEFFYAFFDPSVACEEAHFRVICWTRYPAMAAAFVYSSATGSWTHGTSIGWDAIGLDVPRLQDIRFPGWWPSYAHGCFFWKVNMNNNLIKLDINSVQFSIVGLQPDHENRDIVVVEAGEGRFGMFILTHDLENTDTLHYSIKENEDENAHERHMETTIPLPRYYDHYYIAGAAEGYIFLVGSAEHLSIQKEIFSIEITTLKVERVCGATFVHDPIIPYFGFPPFMSPRRI